LGKWPKKVGWLVAFGKGNQVSLLGLHRFSRKVYKIGRIKEVGPFTLLGLIGEGRLGKVRFGRGKHLGFLLGWQVYRDWMG